MRNIFFSLFLILLNACSSVKNMEIYVPKPTLIELPSEVKKMVIVDKTQGNFLTAIEGVLTGEMIGIDKILTQECITGLTQPFLKNSQIQITKYPERLKSENMTSTGFGAVMKMDQIVQIATLHGADAVMVLEYFDSDFTIREQTRPNNTGSILFQGFAKAKVGIRIYLPKTKNIFYENSFSYSKQYGETATNKNQLLGKLVTGTDAMKSVSYELGRYIGQKFVSYRIWEDRKILKGKSEAITKAERQIVAQDYNNAILTLENEFKIDTKTKNKAAIAHNLGFCYEVLGDLNFSKKWLTESYILSGSTITQSYLNIINQRIEEKAIIESQEKK